MSRRAAPHPGTVIEWSPKGVCVVDPSTRAVKRMETAQDAANLIGTQSVVVAVSRRALFVRTMRVPNAAPSEIDTIIRMKLGDLFPIPSTELAYAIDLTSDVASDGRLAIIVAMPAAELRKLHEDMKAAGFRVHSVVPIAYGSVLLAHTLNQPNCAVASRDESGTGIDIVHEGVLRYSRVAPLHVPVASEVCRTYSVAGLECGEIVVTEGLKVDDADVVSAISPLEALSGEWPSFVPSLELPEAVALRASKQISQRRRFTALLFLAGILFAGLAYVDYVEQADLAAKEDAKFRASTKALTEQKEIAAKEAADATLIQGNLQRAFAPAQKLADVVTVISNRVPSGAWLTGIAVERGKQVTVRGMATNTGAITDFLMNLRAADAAVLAGADQSTSARFRDVQLMFTNDAKIDETTVVQFSVSATPVGNVPMVVQAAKGAKK